MPFLAKNLLFLNSQTQCDEKILFSCYCRVKQGCRLANPERTAERKFNKHWAHVFESVTPNAFDKNVDWEPQTSTVILGSKNYDWLDQMGYADYEMEMSIKVDC